jgi:hypothetical protein
MGLSVQGCFDVNAGEDAQVHRNKCAIDCYI